MGNSKGAKRKGAGSADHVGRYVRRSGPEKISVELLKSGTDDAFARPDSPITPAGHMPANRARSTTARTAGKLTLLTFADIELDPDSYRVRRGGREIHLCPIEFRLLRHLLENPGRVFTRDDLIGAGWRKNVYVGPRTVDVHVGQLRRALGAKSEKDLIRTVRSVGYILAKPGDDPDDDRPDAAATGCTAGSPRRNDPSTN